MKDLHIFYSSGNTMGKKTKIKWRIQKRRMKSSKIQEAQKFERSRGGQLNLTDCVDKIKFYSRLSVPSRKASSIMKQVNSRYQFVFFISSQKSIKAKRIRGNERIQKAKQEKSGDFNE